MAIKFNPLKTKEKIRFSNIIKSFRRNKDLEQSYSNLSPCLRKLVRKKGEELAKILVPSSSQNSDKNYSKNMQNNLSPEFKIKLPDFGFEGKRNLININNKIKESVTSLPRKKSSQNTETDLLKPEIKMPSNKDTQLTPILAESRDYSGDTERSIGTFNNLVKPNQKQFQFKIDVSLFLLKIK